ncbi:MAG: ATP-binding protein [Chthoniobacteraceae bacterium]|jgi:predicted AAA+ superfamily ATPase
MKSRHLAPLLTEALADTPVVFVGGPRQAGKTTLVQGLPEEDYSADYLTMDDAVVLAAAESDPDGFIAGLPGRVILDEVQRAPSLFPAIKRSVDRNRKPGRFLLTGSANAMVLPKVAESLAGRMEILTLWPFSQGEVEGRHEGFIDACFARDFKPRAFTGSDWPSLAERIVVGGYPEALARKEARRRQAWFGSYVTAILERDVRDITNIHGLRELPVLLRLIAARAANVLNITDLARDAGNTPHTTMQRYWALLEAVFLVQTLPAWSGNLSKQLSKAPKILINDTGLLCHLVGLDAQRLKEDSLMTGAVLENFVAMELIKQAGWSRTRPGIFHYRTQKQQEVDLVLEDSRGRLVGIEVKKSASPSDHDFKGLRFLSQETGKKFVRGILLYTGAESVSFGSNLHAVPVSALWNLH